MSQEAIDSFATELIQHLKDVEERGRVINQQSSEEVRDLWMEKSSAVFNFITEHIEQGELPDYSNNTTADFITKKTLLEIINDYLDSKNISPTTKNHVTRALNKHPEIEVQTNYKPVIEDGIEPRRPRAYGGIKLSKKYGRLEGGKLNLMRRGESVFGLTNESTKWGRIVSSWKIQSSLRFLDNPDNGGSAPLADVIDYANLSNSDVEDLLDCDYVKREDDGTLLGVIHIDYSTLNTYLEKQGYVEVDGKMIAPTDWLINHIQSWSRETQREKDEIFDKAEEVGFDRDDMEKALELLSKQNKVKEPYPYMVQRGDEIQ